MTPELIQEYLDFCLRFADSDICSWAYDDYNNGLGNNDFDEDNWYESENVREAFDIWREKNFSTQRICCDFVSKTIHVYELVDSFIPQENS